MPYPSHDGEKMLNIELIPTPSQCIETVAKKEYDEIVRQLLSSRGHSRKSLEIARLLKNFLETADFKKLRAESERHLVEGRHVKFVVYAEEGVPKCNMQISPEPQRSEKNIIQ